MDNFRQETKCEYRVIRINKILVKLAKWQIGPFPEQVLQQLRHEPRVVVDASSVPADCEIPNISDVASFVECETSQQNEASNNGDDIEVKLSKMFESDNHEQRLETKGKKRKRKKREPIADIFQRLFGSELEDLDEEPEKERESESVMPKKCSLPVSLTITDILKNFKRKTDDDLDKIFKKHKLELSFAETAETTTDFCKVSVLVIPPVFKEGAIMSCDKLNAAVATKPEVCSSDTIETVTFPLVDLTNDDTNDNATTVLEFNGIRVEFDKNMAKQDASQSSETANVPVANTVRSMPLLSPLTAAAGPTEAVLPQASAHAEVTQPAKPKKTLIFKLPNETAHQAAQPDLYYIVQEKEQIHVRVVPQKEQQEQSKQQPHHQNLTEKQSNQQQDQRTRQNQHLTAHTMQQQSQHFGVQQQCQRTEENQRIVVQDKQPDQPLQQQDRRTQQNPHLTMFEIQRAQHNQQLQQQDQRLQQNQHVVVQQPNQQTQQIQPSIVQHNQQLQLQQNQHVVVQDKQPNQQMQQSIAQQRQAVIQRNPFLNHLAVPQCQMPSQQQQKQLTQPQENRLQILQNRRIDLNYRLEELARTMNQSNVVHRSEAAPPPIMHRLLHNPRIISISIQLFCELIFPNFYKYLRFSQVTHDYLGHLGAFLSAHEQEEQRNMLLFHNVRNLEMFSMRMIAAINLVAVDNFTLGDVLAILVDKLKKERFEYTMSKACYALHKMLDCVDEHCNTPFLRLFSNNVKTAVETLKSKKKSMPTTFNDLQLLRLRQQIMHFWRIQEWINRQNTITAQQSNNKRSADAFVNVGSKQSKTSKSPKGQRKSLAAASQSSSAVPQIRFERNGLTITQIPDVAVLPNANTSTVVPNVTVHQVPACNQNLRQMAEIARSAPGTAAGSMQTALQIAETPEITSTLCLQEAGERNQEKDVEMVATVSTTTEEEPADIKPDIKPVVGVIDLTWIDDCDDVDILEVFEVEALTAPKVEASSMVKNEESGKIPRETTSPADSGVGSPMREPAQDEGNYKCLCGHTALYLCRCNSAMYCSQDCQSRDWVYHQQLCHKMTS